MKKLQGLYFFLCLSLVYAQTFRCPNNMVRQQGGDIRINIETTGTFYCLWEIRKNTEVNFEITINRRHVTSSFKL